MRERAFSPDRVQFAWIWRAVWAACLLPLMLLVAGGLRDALGANPIEHITRATGDWTLRLLLLTLAVTPLRQLTGWHWLVRLRRTLGGLLQARPYRIAPDVEVEVSGPVSALAASTAPGIRGLLHA